MIAMFVGTKNDCSVFGRFFGIYPLLFEILSSLAVSSRRKTSPNSKTHVARVRNIIIIQWNAIDKCRSQVRFEWVSLCHQHDSDRCKCSARALEI